MSIWGWVKFMWALWQLKTEAKALYDKVHAQYESIKGSGVKPTMSDFKAIVKEALIKAPALITSDGKEVISGMTSSGEVK